MQTREEKPDYGTSITPCREIRAQDQQVWVQLANPDGQGIQKVASLKSNALWAKEDQSHPKKPSGMEAMDGPGNVLAPTFIVQFGKSNGAKTTRQSSKAAVQEEGDPVNAAKVLNVTVQVTREPPRELRRPRRHKAIAK